MNIKNLIEESEQLKDDLKHIDYEALDDHFNAAKKKLDLDKYLDELCKEFGNEDNNK